MINIKNISKSFNNQKVLKDVSLQLPDKGMCFILGESGCGKTTLLNCISGLLTHDGTISINGDVIAALSSDDIALYRLKNIGFVFQDFKLFLHDSVYDNVVMPLQCISKMDKSFQQRRVEDILEVVGMSKYIYEKISNLSGGEKQRIAIARSMINDPKVLLCDEPTGALDSTNKILIMNILKTIATTRLVIVVSHDEDLAKQFADETFIIKDGQILKKIFKSKQKDKRFLPIYKKQDETKKPKLSFKFLFSHTKNAFKQRKFRTVITNLVVSFGLLGSGLAFMLSDTIYESVINTYSNIVSDNQVIVSLKGDQHQSNEIVASDYEKVISLYHRYPEYFSDIGTCYYADFENYFKDKNELTLASSEYRYKIPGYSARNINEFQLISDYDLPIYPDAIDELREDEIIISIDAKMLREICYQFRIEKTVDSLANYLLKNEVLLCFNFANNDWQYSDEQLLRFKGFVLANTPIIFHTNSLWNEYMFESQMRFPINLNFSKSESKPWIFKKSYYLKARENDEEFIEKSCVDINLEKYIFEYANKDYYPLIFNHEKGLNTPRLMVFENHFTSLPPNDWIYMKSLQKSIKNPIFSTNSGYSVYGSSVLSGFNNVVFFSSSYEDLLQITDIIASKGIDPTTSIKLPKNILQGHYTKTSNNGVFFKGITGENVKGNLPKNLNEIVISSGMAKALFNDKNVIGKKLNLATTFSTFNPIENRHNLSFKNDDLLIVGIVENDKNILYQNDYWSLTYFQCNLGISIFKLLPNGMSFEISDKDNSEEVINTLEKAFPQYTFLNPMIDIEKQADNLCGYMRTILFILSIITLIIAVCLISICNNLHVLEIRKDIGLLRCIGINEKESKKMLYFHSFFVSTLGAITTIFELAILYLAIELGIGDLIGMPLKQTFNIIPYTIVMGLSFIIGLIPAYFTSFKLKNLDPLMALKQ